MSAVKAFSFWEWLHVMSVIGGLAAFIVVSVNYLNNQKADTDRDVAALEARLDARTRELEKKMDEIKEDIRAVKTDVTDIKTDLKKTSDMLHDDLSWRYMYKDHPTLNRFLPRYDLDRRKIEFVDASGNVRNP